MARRLKFTVADREPIEVEIGGDVFTAPPLLGAAVLGDLLDLHAELQEAFASLQANLAAGEAEGVATALGILSRPLNCPHCKVQLCDDQVGHHPSPDPTSPPSLDCPDTGEPYRPRPGMFDLILGDETQAAAFRKRLYSRSNPLDLMREVAPAAQALIEEYTGRPTPPSPPSANPSASDGNGSTDGLPAAALTPSGSPLAVSAT